MFEKDDQEVAAQPSLPRIMSKSGLPRRAKARFLPTVRGDLLCRLKKGLKRCLLADDEKVKSPLEVMVQVADIAP